jgi:hypothetical protein
MSQLIKKTIFFLIVLFMCNIGFAQTKNLKEETVKVYGNCGMCKKNIEKAGTEKGVSKTIWDKNTDMATITIDSKKTTIDEVLKKIAAAGYDSDKYRAKDEVYNDLHGCCQYDRPAKVNQ